MSVQRDTDTDAATGMETPATLSFTRPCTLHSACVRHTPTVDIAPLPTCTTAPAQRFDAEWSRTG